MLSSIGIDKSQVSKIHIIYVSYSTLQAPKAVDAFIQASTLSIPELQKKITSQISQQKRMSTLASYLNPDSHYPQALSSWSTIYTLFSYS